MKRALITVLFVAAITIHLQPVWSEAQSLSITGVVRQPLNLLLDDLQGFQSVQVQLNEILEDGSFRGVFHYRGVPLRTLLDTVSVQKEETAFPKPVDLAIRVRNAKGEQVALSWGEVFYRNPARFIVATSATPIMPQKECGKCHTPDKFQPRLDQMKHEIGFPKLVAAEDNYADRSLEGITTIEILDLRPKMVAKRMETFSSANITVTDEAGQTRVLEDFKSLPRLNTRVKHLGEGRGFHGINRFEGVPFKTVLEQSGVNRGLADVFLVSAPDGYRTLFSYGEIFMDPDGDRLLLADTMDGEPITKEGRYWLLSPDDLMSDRMLKAVQKVEAVSLRQAPKVYVIGVGCGDTNLVTLEAISCMARADAFVCPPDIKARFARYMGDKPVLFNIYEFAPPVLKKKHPGLPQEEIDEMLRQRHAHAAGLLKDSLRRNMTVAILDYGDPTLWSGWSWARAYFDEETLEIIPGLSSFNVSNALLERKVDCNGSVVLTTPRGISANRSRLKALAEKGETLCVFMGLKDLPDLVPIFKEYYNLETPAYLVYKAGYAGSEHVIATNLARLEQAAGGYPEKFLGLIYVGPCLGIRGEALASQRDQETLD